MNRTDSSDGGPAFPANVDNAALDVVDYPGMSLRDYFATNAMASMIAKSSGQDTTGGKKGVPLVAQYAYEYADAMLAERMK